MHWSATFSALLAAPIAAFEQFQTLALERHNQLRNLHRNTDSLVLDAALCEQAQAYAEHLVDIDKLEHSDGSHGENLAWSAGREATDDRAVDAVDQWYAEISNYDFSRGQSTGGTIGHFTQVVWDDTTTVGIGMASGSHPDYGVQVFVVAQYLPPGNYVGQYVNHVHPLKSADELLEPTDTTSTSSTSSSSTSASSTTTTKDEFPSVVNTVSWAATENGGGLGFTLFNGNHVLYHQDPTSVSKGSSDTISTDNDITRIVFQALSDSFVGEFEVVDRTGEAVLFTCSDCEDESTSLELNLLFLDTDMSTSINVEHVAYCKGSCEFLRGSTDLTIGTPDNCGSWSTWNSRDGPSGVADNEALLSAHDNSGYTTDGLPAGFCANPTAWEGRNKADQSDRTEQAVTFDMNGLVCFNSDNPEGCHDYEVRMCCPGTPVPTAAPTTTATTTTPTTTATHVCYPEECCHLGFCFIRGKERDTFRNAKRFCIAHGKVLPRPQNDAQNMMYAQAGATWIDVVVNKRIAYPNEGYQNWRIEQRGWITDARNGRWQNRWRDHNLDFFCVNEDEMMNL